MDHGQEDAEAVPYHHYHIPHSQDTLKVETGLVGLRDKKHRNHRIFFLTQQLEHLENLFQRTSYPSANEREEVAQKINLPESKVKIWFQNKRAKARKEGRKVDKTLSSPQTPHSKKSHGFSSKRSSSNSNSDVMQSRQPFKSDADQLSSSSPSCPTLSMDSKMQVAMDQCDINQKNCDLVQSDVKTNSLKARVFSISKEFEPLLIQILLQAPEEI